MARSQLKKQARREEKHSDLSGRLVTVLDPAGPVGEAYRALRTNLLYMSVDTPPEVIVVTSPGFAEGKSTVCANLGVAMAQADKETLIIDCDFRKPAMHKIFDLPSVPGIVDILANQHNLREICRSPTPGLNVLVAGAVPPNPAELLSSQRFAEFLANAREEFDYVLVDSPPVGHVSDPTILATHGDGVLLVLDAQNTRKGSTRQAVRGLAAVGTKILGAVMNNVAKSHNDY